MNEPKKTNIERCRKNFAMDGRVSLFTFVDPKTKEEIKKGARKEKVSYGHFLDAHFNKNPE